MRFRHAALALLPALLTAQAAVKGVPVKISLQVDPPKDGAPPLDTETFVKSLNALVRSRGLVEPPVNGNGWLLGIHLESELVPDGYRVAVETLRLSRISHGQVEQNGSKETVAAVVSKEDEALSKEASLAVILKADDLLDSEKAIGPAPAQHEPEFAPSPGTAPKVLDLDFSEVHLKYQPSMPPYPALAKENHIGGDVVVELTLDHEGVPTTASVLSGPPPLYSYALLWAMRWRFEPVKWKGVPQTARFKIHMHFNPGR